MHNRIMILAVAALCAAPAALAAQQSRGDTLDLPRAVALARAANPMLAARAAMVRAATARIAPAGAWPDPQLTVGAMNYMLPSLTASRDPLSMNQVTVVQPLPLNGALGLRRAAARADSAGADDAREVAVLEVEHEVRTRYWELYHADRALEVMARRLMVLRQIADVATTMYGVGTASQSDALRAQVAITRLGQEVAEMQLDRYRAAVALNELLGRSAETAVMLPATMEHEAHGAEMVALAMPELPPLDSLLAAADERNPEVHGAAAVVDATRAHEGAARRAIWPDLGVGVAYGQRPGSADMLSLMVSVNLPVFARSRQYRQRDEARAMADVAAAELAATRLRVRSAVATARAGAETARHLVGVYASTLVPQAGASYEAALAGYRVGRVDFAALLDSQTMLLEYEHDLHRYEAMYGTAIADLDRLVGRQFTGGQ
jgi:outer membrane protein TolC